MISMVAMLTRIKNREKNHRSFNPILPSVLNIGRLTKILISIKEGIIQKTSYERRANESVDD